MQNKMYNYPERFFWFEYIIYINRREVRTNAAAEDTVKVNSERQPTRLSGC